METRDIKFRAWDRENKCWYEIEELIVGKNNNIVAVLVSEVSVPLYLDRQIDLVQYIGFEDKNGTEIYEGDILGYKKDEEMKVIGVVEFTKGGYWSIKDSTFLWAIRSDREVIGNIYENPDLLEN